MSSEFVTVLCPQPDDRPLAMEAAEARSEVRYVGGAELGEAIASADALFVWDFFSAAVAPAWGRADRPRWVHVAAAGVDRLLFPELVESDVVLTSARGVFDRPIAEYVLGLVLAHVTDLVTRRDQGVEVRVVACWGNTCRGRTTSCSPCP